MRRRCAAASRFSPKGDSRRSARSTSSPRFGSRGWELVVSGLKSDVLHALKAAHHSRDAARRRPVLTRAAALHGARAAHRRLVAAGARIVSLNPLRGTLEDVFVEQVRAADDDRFAAGWRHESDLPSSPAACSGIRFAIASRYGLVFFVDAADGLVVPAGAAHRRSGRQDHQGPRPGAASAIGLFIATFFGIGLVDEGSRAAKHLQPASRSRSRARSSSSASTSGSCSRCWSIWR